MGDLYEKIGMMLREMKEPMHSCKYAKSYPYMEKIIIPWWTKMNYSLHCLTFTLSPRFYDLIYLATPAAGGIARKTPNIDKEVFSGVMEAFEKIACNTFEYIFLHEQFTTFHIKRICMQKQKLKWM